MSETEVTTEVQVDNTDDLDAFSEGFFGQKPVVEDKPSATTEDAEQDELSETEAQTDDEDEAELEQEVVEPTPKKKTVQDRIDEVVRQREELRRDSESQIAQLRKELEDFKNSKAPAPVVEDAEPTPDSVDADGNPIYELGEFDPQYIRDLTRFTLNQERTKVQAETAEAQRVAASQAEQKILETSWNEKVVEAVVEYPDFNEKGRVLLDNFKDLDPNYANYIGNVLMSMDKGPDVLYYLSNHPDEATAIVNSGAQKATLALGRIEARFLQSEIDAPKPKITKAPTPPANRTRGTNGAFVSVAPDTDDLDAFASEFFIRKKK